jgi:gluconolactonase
LFAQPEDPMKKIVWLSLLCPVLVVGPGRGGDEQKPIPGIGPIGKMIKLHTGFDFTEGPAPDRHGNIYFSDIPKEKIHKVNAKGEISVFVDKSNHANGLKVNAKGEIVACEMDGQVVAWSPDGKTRRIVADKHKGKRFNAPNDLGIDKQGGVYFTDPSFRAPKPMPQDKLGVYYVSAEGKVTRLIDDLPNPNGILLSPDEKTLYVIPSGQVEMMAYPVESPGKIGKGRVFCKLKLPENKKGTGGGDGATIDNKGNLYITSTLGLQVFDSEGKLLGIIAVPEKPANVCFGGKDMKTLYITAQKSLYTVRMEATGHAFAPPAK